MPLALKWIAGAFGLILVYLLVANSESVNTIVKSLASFQVATFGTLQGRDVTVAGVSVRGTGRVGG